MSSNSQSDNITGILLRAGSATGRIEKIEIPDNAEGITIVSASDLGKSNIMSIMGTSVKILADGSVDFPYHPVMAVFGTSMENVRLFADRIKIKVSELHESPENVRKVTASEGNTNLYFSEAENNESYKIVNTKFSVERHESMLLSEVNTEVWMQDGQINVQTPTQWPVFLKKNVASVFGFDSKNIVLNVPHYTAPRDELVYSTAMLAVIASYGFKKTGVRTSLIAQIASFQMQLDFSLSSVVDTSTGAIVAGRYTANADVGAYPVLDQEIATQIMSGLVPYYNINAASFEVNIIKSPSPPSNFFVDLGYAMSTCALENHVTDIALSCKMHPDKWRTEHAAKGNTNLLNSVFSNIKFNSMAETISKVSELSDFTRKFASYAKTGLLQNNIAPFIAYSKGIGIASAYGVQGFSSKFSHISEFTLSLYKDYSGRITICSSIPPEEYEVNIWKDAVRKYIPIDRDKILFSDINDSRMQDSGPTIMSRNISAIPYLIEKAAMDIAWQPNKGHNYGQSAIVHRDFQPESPFFEVNCIGSMVIALHVDPVIMVPVVDTVWIALKCGYILNKSSFRSSIIKNINSAIKEICPDVKSTYNVELVVESDSTVHSGSAQMAIRSMTVAAFTDAVSQAVSHRINKIPVRCEDIAAILGNLQKGGADE